MKLEHKDIWTGNYRGINFQIVNWGKRFKNHEDDRILKSSHRWNYYICLWWSHFVRPVDIKQAKNAKSYELFDTWFEGMSFSWHELIYLERRNIGVKLGVDYGSRECPEYITLDQVAADCRYTISRVRDSLRYLNKCQGTGQLVKEADGWYSQDLSEFYSKSHIESNPNIDKAKWLERLNVDGASLSAKLNTCTYALALL